MIIVFTINWCNQSKISNVKVLFFPSKYNWLNQMNQNQNATKIMRCYTEIRFSMHRSVLDSWISLIFRMAKKWTKEPNLPSALQWSHWVSHTPIPVATGWNIVWEFIKRVIKASNPGVPSSSCATFYSKWSRVELIKVKRCRKVIHFLTIEQIDQSKNNRYPIVRSWNIDKPSFNWC